MKLNPIGEQPKIHRLALVDDSCTIGEGTKVWQFASVIRSSKIGSYCNIATGVIVDGARVGDRSLISHGAFIDPGIVIGADVFIGPQVSMCNDYWPRAHKNGWFDIAELIRGEIVVSLVCDGASIGANAVVMPGVRIGSRAMIAAAACVDRDVPDGFLFKRGGKIVPIDPQRQPDRKRQVW